ncbi:MAG: hypothetical protein LKJ83_04025 [Eubacteriaceae bacterium]|jgi:hypothetical protein|nr:hypothetical protein [Eubacteriaceae bacterium]
MANNPDTIFNDRHKLNELDAKYSVQLKNLKYELARLPKESLSVMKQNGKVYYYAYRYDGKIHRRGITKDEKMLSLLIRKKEVIESIRYVNQQQAGVRTALAKMPEVSKNITLHYSGGRKFLSPRPEGWSDVNQSEMEKHRDSLKMTTTWGVAVKSFGEKLLGDLFEEYGLRTWYEKKQMINGSSVFPDFTIIHPFTGETWIWEHKGEINDLKVLHQFYEKIKWYSLAGIKPGKNLVITYSREDYSLNEGLFRHLIDAIFIHPDIPVPDVQ